MELGYLLNPAFQYENRNGKPLVGGFLKVFKHGTTIPYITWKNFDGDRNPAEIPLNDLGMAVVLVETGNLYDVYCYDINRVEQWSRVNVGTYGGAGGASGASGDGFGAIRCTGVSRLATDGSFQYSVQELNGDSLEVLSGVLRADTGWYHYDATVRLIWESSPANRETQVKLAAYLNDDLASDVTAFDMGYSHDETVRVSGEVKVLADDTVFNITVTGMPAGMEAQLVDFGMHTVNAQGGSGGGSEGAQADWDETDPISPSYIRHKPAQKPVYAEDGIEVVEEADRFKIGLSSALRNEIQQLRTDVNRIDSRGLVYHGDAGANRISFG